MKNDCYLVLHSEEQHLRVKDVFSIEPNGETPEDAKGKDHPIIFEHGVFHIQGEVEDYHEEYKTFISIAEAKEIIKTLTALIQQIED